MGTRRVSDEIVLFSRGAFWSYQQSPVGMYVINKARNEAKLNMAVLKKKTYGEHQPIACRPEQLPNSEMKENCSLK